MTTYEDRNFTLSEIERGAMDDSKSLFSALESRHSIDSTGYGVEDTDETVTTEIPEDHKQQPNNKREEAAEGEAASEDTTRHRHTSRSVSSSRQYNGNYSTASSYHVGTNRERDTLHDEYNPKRRSTASLTSMQHHHQKQAAAAGETQCWIDRLRLFCLCEHHDNFHVARRETKAIGILRFAILLLLLVAATVVSVGVHFYTKNEDQDKFETEFEAHATRIIETFHEAVERRLGAINSMATTMTSFALATNQSFPFVTLPDFAIRGCDLRIQADAMVIHYMPLVYDDDREAWENYSLAHRFHIDESFQMDAAMRELQDIEFGLIEKEKDEEPPPPASNQDAGDEGPPDRGDDTFDMGPRSLQDDNRTVLDDDTNFHPKIWSIGPFTPKGDEPVGSGPFLPLWQRSPINGKKQEMLNWNFAGTFVFNGVLEKLLETKEAIMNKATKATTEAGKSALKANLAISQYRHDVGAFIDDPLTFLAYPVWTSFDRNTREIGGVLATNIHWKLFFRRILPPSATGILCVLQNSYNQTLSYLVDGSEATYLGEVDLHDSRYNHMVQSASINDYLQRMASPETRSYTTVPLCQEYGKYTLRVYPTRATEETYESNDPMIYTTIVVCVFLFTSIVFITFALVVERRQQIIMKTSIANAKKVADTERELNEFLSHEVRNPLAAAMSACSFVKSAVSGETADGVSKAEFRKSLLDDIRVVDTSLRFVNDFLRSMLDMHRAKIDRVDLKLTPADVKRDILDAVCRMLYQRGFAFSVSRECASGLCIETDVLRLKQVLLNLGVNASKFVENGFIRFRATVVDGLVEIYVEDSGPGIPEDKRAKLFDKCQDHLNELSQGTGIGLGLSQSLIKSLNGDLWLDESYHSGVQGCPGARFVIQLNTAPLPPEALPIHRNSDNTMNSIATTEAGTTIDPVADDPTLTGLPENQSVLFVDDDMVLRKLFSRAVKKVAPTWTIEQAPDGMTALKLTEDEAAHFDIIFMDQYMPSTEKNLLGTETVQALREKGIKSRICGLSANDLETEFLEAGADCFTVKPIPCDKTELEGLLLRVLLG